MSTASITERLAGLFDRTPPFDTLTEEQRRGLVSTLEIYKAGEVILEQGEDIHRALYVVESGLVRLTDVEAGRLLDMCGPGAQFGSYGLVQGGMLPYEARAVDETTCALVAADRFRELLKENDAFRRYFDEDIKRYVRSLASDLDASGAFLLFDTPLASLISRAPVTAAPETPVRDVARAMAEAEVDTAVVVRDGAPVGVVTEGDMLEKVVAQGASPDTPVMQLVERPPVALAGTERLFDAVRVMMHHRIRRVVVVDRAGGGEGGSLLGVLTTEDVAHIRGLDPVATTERIERAGSIDELATIRTESNRRLFRLYQQGVQSEDLVGVVNELDDQLKRRLVHLVAEEARAEGSGYDGPWAWLTFGSPGRRESTLSARQDNGLVWADPPDEAAAAHAHAYFAALAARANTAFERCGFVATETGLLAREEPFRQPLAQWRAAYAAWATAQDAAATDRAAMVFDLRTLVGEEALADALREEVAAHLPNPRLVRVMLQRGTRVTVPVGFLGRFELERDEQGREGINLRERGLVPVVAMARALALDAGYLRSANTFDRLRHVAALEGNPNAGVAKELIGAYATLSDLHLRHQMQQAERGETPGDRIDPDDLHRSQQNLLKEAFKAVEHAQKALRDRFGEL